MKLLKITMVIFLSCFFINCYAIRVSVHTASKDVYGVGFYANGKGFGSIGKNYNKTDAPVGMYKFGLRAGGLIIGKKEVTCLIGGRALVKLDQDATVTLDYDGNKCEAYLQK